MVPPPRTWVPMGARPVAPPLWLVSEGGRTAGPLSTEHLVEHARHGLSRSVHARPRARAAWRRLGELREVRLLDETAFERSKRLGATRSLAEEALLRLSDDPKETLALGLRVAAQRLGAEFGFVHRFEPDRATPVTRIAWGTGAAGRIGAPVLERDELAKAARARLLAVGDAREHHAFHVAASRLGGSAGEVIGVAMAPVFVGARIAAMIEIGRTERAFRASDARALGAILRVVEARLAAGAAA
ncbi:MAG: hypothetical protein U0414_35125 [Polyangiaceae bacterium]